MENITPHTNRLINETSPYLLQHAHNPVDWYPWGEAAFEKARKENKLVLISIGYAACHWCHVMELESFEDDTVAQIMNDYFVCIKVDREERPDVDHTYMAAVQLMTGSGGWPLNCFALPDGRPVFGGTYFPKAKWMSVLNQLQRMYANERQRVLSSAEELTKGLHQQNLIILNTDENNFTPNDLKQALTNWKPYFDKQSGGNRGAPKFPMPDNYLFLLKYYYFSEDADIKKHLELSLDNMASGGIYDALGGGFARYSTDGIWKVPHFEKMLYDNAQLVSVYAKAYRLFAKPLYKQRVYESLSFMERELTSADGTFYASIDADSEGEEGTYYIWTKAEIEQLLKEDAPVFMAFYGITEEGNWEGGKNVLHQIQSVKQLAKDVELTESQIWQSLEKSRKILFAQRSQRERPMTDTKVLTSWNALAISAFVNAYRTFGEKAFLEKAIRAARYFKTHSVGADGRVLRMIRKNADIPGFLDDYSMLAQAFIDLYQATFDEEWLNLSLRITEYSLQHFYDESSGMFFYSNLSEDMTISRKIEISDNVIPSSNSVMAGLLLPLGVYFDREEYIDKAGQMLSNVLPQIDKQLSFSSNWGSLFCDFAFAPPEVVFTGKEAENLRKAFDRNFVEALVAGSTNESSLPLLDKRIVKNESLIYVCRNRVCKLPVKSVAEALKQIGEE
ncbi:MAG: thioredoxin domain-containing protein [Bacteroidales bacterium]|nr:thioredoxin domain-containing protein [Bacteroidales bacterium]